MCYLNRTYHVLPTLITQGIDEILKKFEHAHFDHLRFGNLFHGGFRASFTTLRHVRKFINGLEFAFGIVGRELNGVDITGVEALRLFYPKTYEAVRSHKEIFAGHIDTLTAKRGHEPYKKSADDVLGATGEFSETLKALLVDLFPKLSYAYGDTNYGHESETLWEKSHRVATTRYFDAYFQLSLAPTEVTIAEITQLIQESGDERKVLELLRELAAKGKTKHAMESLRFRLPDVPGLNLPELLSALVQFGDNASDEGAPLAGIISEYWHVRWVIFDVLEKLQPESRPEILLTITKTRFAPRTLLNMLTLIPQVAAEKGTYEEFTEQRLAEVRAALANSVEAAAVQDKVSLKTESLPAIIHIWTAWGKKENARLFIARVARSDDDILELVNRFIYQTHSYGGRDRVGRKHNRLATTTLASVVDLDDLRERLQRMDEQKLDSEKLEIRRIALADLTRMHEKGLTPEQFDSSQFLDDN